MKRLYSFDVLRLMLVLLALTSHLMLYQEWHVFLSENAFRNIRFFTRTSMPGLIIVFGFMVQYVYFEKIKLSSQKVIYKFVGKMALCYFSFVTISLVGLLFNVNSLIVFLGSIVLVAPATFANLFKYYFFLFPLAFFMLAGVQKCGWKWGVGVVGVLWLIAELSSYSVVLPSYLSHVGGLFFGIADVWGPSIAHASLLMLFGMVLANVYTEYRIQNTEYRIQLLA